MGLKEEIRHMKLERAGLVAEGDKFRGELAEVGSCGTYALADAAQLQQQLEFLREQILRLNGEARPCDKCRQLAGLQRTPLAPLTRAAHIYQYKATIHELLTEIGKQETERFQRFMKQ